MSKQKLNLLITVPERVYLEKEVDSLTVCTNGGVLTILAKHMDLMAPIKISKLIINDNGHVNNYAVGGGFINVYQQENRVCLMLNSIESIDEINLERALAAKKKAEEALENAKSVREQQKNEIKLKRALNRITLKNGE